MALISLSAKHGLIVFEIEWSGLLKFISKQYCLFTTLRIHVQVFLQALELLVGELLNVQLG